MPVKTKEVSTDFKVVPIVRKARMKDIDEDKEDLAYWLSRPVIERSAAVTFLVSQSLKAGERMDKSIVVKKKVVQK